MVTTIGQEFRFADYQLEGLAIMCGFRHVVDFLAWAEPHVVRGEN